MLKRSLTGVAIFLVVVGFVALRYISTLFFDFFVLALSIVAVIETFSAMKNGENKNEPFYSLACLYPLLIFAIHILGRDSLQKILLQISAILLILIASFISELVILTKKKKNGVEVPQHKLLSKTASTLFVIIYPATILGFMYGINSFGLYLGMIGIIVMFAVSMFTDVFAYFFGTLFRGKGAKVCTQISPNKGIIGVIAGSAGGVVASWICFFIFDALGFFVDNLSVVSFDIKVVFAFLLVGVFGTIITQVGDFVSSAIKRRYAIKDFGKIFPGHGGVMDRVDGLMFNGLLVFVVFSLLLL